MTASVIRTGNTASFSYTPPMRIYGGIRTLLTLGQTVEPKVLATVLRGFWRFSPHTRALVTDHPSLDPERMFGANMAVVTFEGLPLRPYVPEGATVKRPVMASHMFADCDGCVTLLSVHPDELDSEMPPSLSVLLEYAMGNTDAEMVFRGLGSYFAGAIIHLDDKIVWGDDLLEVDATAYRLAGKPLPELLKTLIKETA
jgi:hypothetical protein